MYYLYILFSESCNIYYVGYTSNYKQRLLQHNNQEYFNTFTAKYRPWKIAALFICGADEKLAINTERFIKKQKSRKLIEQLVNPLFIPSGKLTQLVRVPDVRD